MLKKRQQVRNNCRLIHSVFFCRLRSLLKVNPLLYYIHEGTIGSKNTCGTSVIFFNLEITIVGLVWFFEFEILEDSVFVWFDYQRISFFSWVGSNFIKDWDSQEPSSEQHLWFFNFCDLKIFLLRSVTINFVCFQQTLLILTEK